MKSQVRNSASLFPVKMAMAIRQQPGYRPGVKLMVSHAKNDPPKTWRLFVQVGGKWMDASLQPQKEV